jgi:peptidoglycan/LPS O-acetylase OafA/YrhL
VSDSSPVPRLGYLDTLRLALTILVVVHHALITYGADGSWFYVEPADSRAWSALASVIVAADQLFFMGAFFLVAGYLTPAAFDRKGAGFLRGRVVRLGLLLRVALVVVSPYLELAKSESLGQPSASYWHELSWRLRAGERSPGPLWFVEVLLGFSLLYGVGRVLLARRAAAPRPPGAGVGHGSLGLLAVAIALASFGLRVWFPIGREVAHLQLGFLGQYGILCAAGIWAGRRDAFAALAPDVAGTWLRIALAAFVGLIGLAAAAGGLDPDATRGLRGGLDPGAAAAALLESLYCVAVIAALLVGFRDRIGAPTLARRLAPDAYSVYALHAPVLVAIAVAMASWSAPPPVKAALAAAATLAACFALSHLALRRIALVRRVL